MLGIDTNVLVRYLVQDDDIQSPVATELIESKLTAHAPGYVSTIVLVEVCWTLKRAYHVDNVMLCTVLEKLLTTVELSFEHRDECWQAFQAFKFHGGDYADALIGFIHKQAGCHATLTFDKKASKLGAFELLK